MKFLISLSLLIVSICCYGQREIRIDSIGQKQGNNIELIAKDTIFIYHWRGMGVPKVERGMIAVINPPTRRLKYYYITIKR